MRKDKNKQQTSPGSTRNNPLPASDLIGRKLRDFYDGVAKEPLPERFVDLLAKLDQASSKDDDNGSSR